MSEAHENELLQNIASLEGQALAQKLILAMLVHCARTSQKFEVVYREIDSIKQLFIDDALTMFPSQRIFFTMGFNDGFSSTAGMADAISEILAARGHS